MTAPEPTWECPRCGGVGCEGGAVCPSRSAPEPASDALEGLGSYIQGLRDWAQMDCVPSAVGDVIRDCATTIEALSRQSPRTDHTGAALVEMIVKQGLSVATLGTPGEIGYQIAHNTAIAAIEVLSRQSGEVSEAMVDAGYKVLTSAPDMGFRYKLPFVYRAMQEARDD